MLRDKSAEAASALSHQQLRPSTPGVRPYLGKVRMKTLSVHEKDETTGEARVVVQLVAIGTEAFSMEEERATVRLQALARARQHNLEKTTNRLQGGGASWSGGAAQEEARTATGQREPPSKQVAGSTHAGETESTVTKVTPSSPLSSAPPVPPRRRRASAAASVAKPTASPQADASEAAAEAPLTSDPAVVAGTCLMAAAVAATSKREPERKLSKEEERQTNMQGVGTGAARDGSRRASRGTPDSTTARGWLEIEKEEDEAIRAAARSVVSHDPTANNDTNAASSNNDSDDAVASMSYDASASSATLDASTVFRNFPTLRQSLRVSSAATPVGSPSAAPAMAAAAALEAASEAQRQPAMDSSGAAVVSRTTRQGIAVWLGRMSAAVQWVAAITGGAPPDLEDPSPSSSLSSSSSSSSSCCAAAVTDGASPPPHASDAREAVRAAERAVHAWLLNGERLCELANAIKPGSVQHINRSNVPFRMLENIAAYVDACREIGLPPVCATARHKQPTPPPLSILALPMHDQVPATTSLPPWTLTPCSTPSPCYA